MIPSVLEYTKASSIDEAIAAVAAGARPISGGQSLMPMMRLRLAAPEAIVDLGGIPELVGICEDDDEIAVGAMTTHRAVSIDPLIRAHAGLVSDAAGGIGSPQVRNRGTIGGSLGHADPHSDMPATLVAAGASVIARGPKGERRIAVEDLIETYLTTSLAEDEIITQVRIPKNDDKSAYAKFHRRAIDWTIVGVGVCIGADGVRAAATGVADKPVRLAAFEAVLNGGGSIDDAVAKAAEGIEPHGDLDGSAEYKKHLVGVLAARAHAQASSR
ncbi:MAG: FAD binding domain-containing protein [Gaiellales bacterium]